MPGCGKLRTEIGKGRYSAGLRRINGGRDLTNFSCVGDGFGSGRRWLRAFDFQADQLLVDVALRADALDDLLAEVTAFGEADRVHLLCFLRQRLFVDVLAVARLSIFDADDAGVVRGGNLRARGLQFCDDRIGFGRGAIDARAWLAGLCNARDGVLAPRGERVITRNRRADLRQDAPRRQGLPRRYRRWRT